MLVPDAEMSEATFNQLFISNDYTLENIGNYTFMEDYEDDICTERINRININPSNTSKYKASLTNVQEDVKSLTDGTMYFSTMAGSPHEPSKTSDVEKRWNTTAPQDLTESETVVRGRWGVYVGMGIPEGNENAPYQYGDVYNIK